MKRVSLSCSNGILETKITLRADFLLFKFRPYGDVVEESFMARMTLVNNFFLSIVALIGTTCMLLARLACVFYCSLLYH